jgi:CheY-like chemotaxis protein
VKPGGKMTIVIVDDNFDDLIQAKEMLEKAGYKTLVATNGAQAYDLIEKEPCELLLLDIKMPTLTGYDLMRLTRSKHNGNMKIIYVSVIPAKEVAMVGVDGFVQKPYSEKTLLATVKKVLKN